MPRGVILSGGDSCVNFRRHKGEGRGLKNPQGGGRQQLLLRHNKMEISSVTYKNNNIKNVYIYIYISFGSGQEKLQLLSERLVSLGIMAGPN